MSGSPLTREAVVAVARSLADPAVCPVCGSPLTGPRCGTCGADLSRPEAARVWSAGVQASRLLLDRDRVLGQLTAPRAPVSATVRAPEPPAPVTQAAAAGRGWRVHEVLVGVGALLLAVAAVGFLVFSWRVLPLAGRAAVIAGVTVTVLGVATRLRTRLRETAEAVAALGIVLLLADAGAVRATGLLGADDVDAQLYAAAATGVCALLLAAWTAFARLRAGSLAVCVLTPAAVFLFGRYADLAVVAALVVAAGTLIRVRLPLNTVAERRVLRVVAALALVAAPALTESLGALALTLPAVALITLAQCSADVPRAWSAAGGVALALAAAVAGVRVDDALDLAEFTQLIPPVVGVSAVVAGIGFLRLPRTRPTSLGAGAVATAVLVTTPAALAAIWPAARAAWSVADPWTAAPTDALAGVDTSLWPAAVVSLTALGAALLTGARTAPWIRRFTRPVRWVAQAALGAAAVVLPLHPQAPIWLAVTGLMLVAVVATALEQPVAGAVAGTVAVLLAWSAEELSVPATVIGIAGLVLARQAVRRLELRVALTGAAATASLVVAGAVAAMAGADRLTSLTWAAVAAAPLLAAALTVPAGRGWHDGEDQRADPVVGEPAGAVGPPRRATPAAAERLAAAAPALATLVAGVVVAEVDGPAWAARLLLALALGAATLGAAFAGTASNRVAAASLAPLAGLLAASYALEKPLTWAIVTLAGAVLVTLLAAARLGSRRIPAELGLVVTGGVALALVRDAGQLWPVLLLLGAAAGAVATARDRRAVGWVAGVLLTGATWTRLGVADVGLVEAYSLPPALALLGLALHRLHTDDGIDRNVDAQRLLTPVALLAFLPSIGAVAAGSGSDLRPALLLVAAALVTLVPRTGWIGPVAAVATAVATAVVQAAAALDASPGLADVEVWTIPAAVILLVHGRRRLEEGSWAAFGPGLALLIGPSLYLGVQPGSGTELRQIITIALAAATLATGAGQRLQAAVALGAGALTLQALVLLSPRIAELRDAVPVWGWLALVGLALLVLGAGYERRLRQVRALGLRLAALR